MACFFDVLLRVARKTWLGMSHSGHYQFSGHGGCNGLEVEILRVFTPLFTCIHHEALVTLRFSRLKINQSLQVNWVSDALLSSPWGSAWLKGGVVGGNSDLSLNNGQVLPDWGFYPRYLFRAVAVGRFRTVVKRHHHHSCGNAYCINCI